MTQNIFIILIIFLLCIVFGSLELVSSQRDDLKSQRDDLKKEAIRGCMLMRKFSISFAS